MIIAFNCLLAKSVYFFSLIGSKWKRFIAVWEKLAKSTRMREISVRKQVFAIKNEARTQMVEFDLVIFYLSRLLQGIV